MKHLPTVSIALIAVGTLGFAVNRMIASQTRMGDRWIGNPQSYSGELLEVINTDLLRVRLNGGEEIIRLCGIQAPEQVSVAAGAEALINQLVEEVSGQVMVLPFERDSDGYVVAEVFVIAGDQEKSVQEELLLSGLASVSSQAQDCLNGEAMSRAEGLAMERRLGQWQQSDER